MSCNNCNIGRFGLLTVGIAIISILSFKFGAKSTLSTIRHGISSNLRYSESITVNGKVFTSGQVGSGKTIQEATQNALNDVGNIAIASP